MGVSRGSRVGRASRAVRRASGRARTRFPCCAPSGFRLQAPLCGDRVGPRPPQSEGLNGICSRRSGGTVSGLLWPQPWKSVRASVPWRLPGAFEGTWGRHGVAIRPPGSCPADHGPITATHPGAPPR